MSDKKKVLKGFKLPSSYTVLIIVIAIMAVLTWIIPAGAFVDGVYKSQAAHPQGFWDVIMAPVRAMLGTSPEEGSLVKSTSAAIDVAFFILMVGGFLGVVNKTGTLDVGIASIVRKFKGREKMLILVLMPIFALGGTTYGMGEETMAFYPLLIPIMMAVGFDTITGVAIILIGSQIGCLASTLNPFATGIASATAGVGVGDGIVLRLIFWVVLTAVSTYYVYRYAGKIQKDPTKSIVYSTRAEDEKFFSLEEAEKIESKMNGKQKAVFVFFVITFVIMIMGFIPWPDLGVHIFDDFTAWLTGIPGVGAVVGTSLSAFGTWYFPEGAMLFMVMGILIGMIYRLKESTIASSFIAGAADLLSVALIVALARGVQVIMNDGMITDTILYWGKMALSGLPPQVFIVLTYIFYLPMSILIPSSSGLAGATMGIMAPLGEFAGVHASLVITAYQSASGLLNILAPTSGIVMGALALGRVDLGKWWKFVGKLALIIIAITILLLLLGTFLPFL
ncbi:YfcC family protein [Alloscardovia theropitheci]|uniref:YfcC family protein n=1 Tax=Alloscardovia theropitheci TaxID=2496842 RepID=A0A4V2MU89_9BIFI|nr:YfcC family protein [Alloscardovia theropitheci]TCD53729.1 YfcC family protein [Alloscardovia theropitheci]